MRYALISDVHGNLEALEAVIEALQKERVDEYLSTGDIIGYGADPSKCIERVRGLTEKVVCGNHEWAVRDLKYTDYFNPYAKAAVYWTRQMINTEELNYANSLNHLLKEKDFTLVHGTLHRPEEFRYMRDEREALMSFRLQDTPLCFLGHTHSPGIYWEREGRISYSQDKIVKLAEGTKYIINCGSIGQPRDGNPKASYCIYDDEAKKIEFKRIAYDIKKAQDKIRGAGLPDIIADRLAEGR
ncbi:MAG: metallophosphoesterase family protein [Candidatus Omnitrophica bacterium]|nr:metallophosphoesterase family protein [Candidatus Omnitrophota bacterium]